MTDRPPQTDALAEELRALRAELALLNSHRFVRIHNSLPRLLAFGFARGLAVGLGTVLGATVLLSVIVWSLSQIEFLPIIGDWAAQIAEQMRAAQE
jgi:GAF domain-containing protein